jgi:ubiquinone/menaquinone biosynthesis C-methylase UbiE
MKHPQLMSHALLENLNGVKSPKIVELGAGDGDFLLSVASRLQKEMPDAEAIMVDRLDSFDPKIHEEFKNLGWRLRTEIVEVFDWLRQSPPDSADAIVANLFLHQFQSNELAEMLRLAARSTKLFIALETSRAWLPRLCGHFLWVIGCGPVTRHDAGISIRAGFLRREISAMWEDKDRWELTERPVGLFSHLFIARRKE